MRPDARNEARPRLAGRGARYFLSGDVVELVFDARSIIAAPQRKGYSRPRRELRDGAGHGER